MPDTTRGSAASEWASVGEMLAPLSEDPLPSPARRSALAGGLVAATVQPWPRRDDITPHRLVEAVANALAADHADCDPESCCQRNSGPDWVEAHKALAAVNTAGYRIVEASDGT